MIYEWILHNGTVASQNFHANTVDLIEYTQKKNIAIDLLCKFI